MRIASLRRWPLSVATYHHPKDPHKHVAQAAVADRLRSLTGCMTVQPRVQYGLAVMRKGD